MNKKGIEGFRLSSQQEYLWALQERGPGFCVQCAVLIDGKLNENVLRKVLDAALRRHEILRTTFQRLPGMGLPIQVIDRIGSYFYRQIDLSDNPWAKQMVTVDELLLNERCFKYDFERGPLLRCHLLVLSPEKHILLINLPSLCADGIALDRLVQEISESYCDSWAETSSPDDRIDYIDYCEWQRELRGTEEWENGSRFWKGQRFSLVSNARLPFQEKTLGKSPFHPEILTLVIEPDLQGKMQVLCDQQQISLEAYLLTCWSVLLSRLTGKSDIIVGTLCDGRSSKKLSNTLGLFCRCLPVRSQLSENLKFTDMLSNTEACLAESCLWQEYYFGGNEKEGIEIERGGERSNCFPFCFGFERRPALATRGEMIFMMLQQYGCTHPFDIKLSCIQDDHSVFVEFHYDREGFENQTVERLKGQFETFLRNITESPDCPLSHVPILPLEERDRVLIGFNKTQADYPKDKTIHELFEEQVLHTPDKTAVIFEDQALTYQELNCKANQIAHALKNKGAGPDVLVGILMERSLEMIVGILGILKSGAAYLPLDPSDPKERLDFLLNETEVPIVLAQEKFSELISSGKFKALLVDKERQNISSEREDNPSRLASPDNLAYCIYTSGSTGTIKGVTVTHRTLVNSVRARFGYYKGEVKYFLLLPRFTFDSSIASIFWTLCSGGSLSIIREGLHKDPAEIGALIRKRKISHMLLVPGLYRELLREDTKGALFSLDTVIVAGEECSNEIKSEHFDKLENSKFYNEYGVTEASVWSSVYRIERGLNNKKVPIGTPIANTQIYLLDPNLEPVPIGVPGELHIAGAGLARGYLNRPDLTAERFIPNPFSEAEGERLYKTGDLARYLPDGNIEFLGRIDHQVKIRGFRIECGEIESVLREYPSLQEVVVIPKEDPEGNKSLVSYLIPKAQDSKPNTTDLRNYLKDKLPDYMIPSHFIFLEKLPLTPNGKLDRKALPEPDTLRPDLEHEYVPPRTPEEEMLCQTFQEVLKVEKVGIYDNFFDLGGHSLLATQVINRIRQIFSLDIPLKSLFESPRIADLAEEVMITQLEITGEAKTSKILSELEAMTDEEVIRLLSEKGKYGKATT